MRSRREEVIELLLVGSAAKLEAGMTAAAGRLLERAYRISIEPEPLPGPWASLAAYRLALVELRRQLTVAELERVVELLDQASGSDLLEPWPALYRLAALTRLGQTGRKLTLEMQRAMELARASKRRVDERAWGLLGPTAGSKAESMVEFFGLCQGLELDGSSRRQRGGLALSRGTFNWQLVGSVIGLHPQSLPRPFAIAEFEAYQARKESTEQLYFALPAQGTAWMSLAGGEPEPSHPQGLRLLTALLTDPPMSSERLRERVLGPDASDAAWDKARSRINKRLGAMLGHPGRAAIVLNEQGLFVLAPELRVLGLVERDALDPTVRRRGSRFASDRPIGFYNRK
jgi:hypothetical protein